MKIGYPCINLSLPCKSTSTFRLASYTEERLQETVSKNLACLGDILQYNVAHNLLFFRISSDIIPFASHPICTFPWQKSYRQTLQELGTSITKHKVRISMHPDQFVLLNAKDSGIVERSILELQYHAELLDGLGLDMSAKIQIHVGGVYGDKEASMKRFISVYRTLPKSIQRRLVIENDDRLYSVADCLSIHMQTGVPILLDTFHHTLLNTGESLADAFQIVSSTWNEGDGVPMLDYSTQEPGRRVGNHAASINLEDFSLMLSHLYPKDADIMLEIKDKEISALKALTILPA